MSADFLLAVTKVPSTEEQETYKAALPTLSSLDWVKLLEDHGCPLLPEGSDYDRSSEHEGDCRQIAADVLQTVLKMDALEGVDTREIAWFWIDGNKYIASGGMSWGDSPTDAYDDLVCFTTILDYIKDKESYL
jgi:hypothetical protein